ncbi:MAG: Na-translocating system protein MpsC family protein [Propionibacteriaceae bacterium]
MAVVTRLSVSTAEPDGGVPSGGPKPERNVVSPDEERGTIDGQAAMAICNAITGALKRNSGKGPTKVKAYGTREHVAVIVQDMLTTLERTLVQEGHEQLVGEARQALIGRVAKECRATIEQATGRRVVGWQTEVNPSADRSFTLIQLQPL